ncbi:MAG: hypothetical protein AB7G80_09235 [Dongiaceae bacterium]
MKNFLIILFFLIPFLGQQSFAASPASPEDIKKAEQKIKSVCLEKAEPIMAKGSMVGRMRGQTIYIKCITQKITICMKDYFIPKSKTSYNGGQGYIIKDLLEDLDIISQRYGLIMSGIYLNHKSLIDSETGETYPAGTDAWVRPDERLSQFYDYLLHILLESFVENYMPLPAACK